MKNRIIAYWIVTGLLAVALLGSGIGALTRQKFLVEAMQHLGFPLYVMRILGTWYVIAAVALVVPGLARVKEWAYAGIIFAMTGHWPRTISRETRLQTSCRPSY